MDQILDLDELIASWSNRHDLMTTKWQLVRTRQHAAGEADVIDWERRLRFMVSRRDAAIADGTWRGGPRTLLSALGLEYRELTMTAGLAWLLRPDGHHGLGSRVLREFLDRAGVPWSGALTAVSVVLEELRGDTRADLLVYGNDWTIVIEAKTFALEQDRQLDRLYENWADDPGCRFFFLTRGRREPRTCEASRAYWDLITWHDIASMLRNALSQTRGRAAAGVHEYLETLEAYHP